MIKKLTSVLLTLCLAAAVIPFSTAAVFAASGGESVYVMQEGSGKCTLASAVMLVRQAAIESGASSDQWKQITQTSLKQAAWVEGVGLRHSFSYSGISVSYKNLTVEDKSAELIRLLSQHPEGIEIYLRSVPHAVLLTRYDSKTDTFYYADPAVSTSEMAVEKSWLRTLKTGATQEEIIDAVDCYWYVSSNKYQPSSSQGGQSGNGGTADNDNGGASDDDIIAGGDDKPQIEVVKLSKVNTYRSGQFSDLTGSEWYFDYAKSAYEMGLMNGSDGKFDPNGNMTIGQTITIAARIYSTYAQDGYNFSVQEGDPWYKPYVDYAYKKGIISDKYRNANMNAKAARLEFAEILSKCLPDKALEPINQVKSGEFPDVSSTSDAGKAVYKLCEAGILTGSSDGKFHPADSISRAEASAVIARLADSTQRAKR